MSEPVDTPHVAVLWMIFGSICFGTMNALVKYTSGLEGIDVWMIILVRSAVIAFAVVGFAFKISFFLAGANAPGVPFVQLAMCLAKEDNCV